MRGRSTRAKAALLLLMVGMVACSNEESRAKKSYLVACNLALHNEQLCSCTYDRLREKHSAEELRQASTDGSMPPPELARDMTEVTLECVKRAQGNQ